jgi:prefoldin subunit 5
MVDEDQYYNALETLTRRIRTLESERETFIERIAELEQQLENVEDQMVD